MSMFDTFKVLIVLMAFFSFGMTMLAYVLPNEAVTLEVFSSVATQFEDKDVSGKLQDTIDSQTTIPAVDLGALIFFSGNIVLDLLLNFVFAIPEMIGLIVSGFMLLFNVDGYLFAQVQLLASIIMMTLYFIGLLQMVLNIRSRGTIV